MLSIVHILSLSQLKYKAEAEKMKSKYSVVTHTPLYVQNVLSGKNLSEVSICISVPINLFPFSLMIMA